MDRQEREDRLQSEIHTGREAARLKNQVLAEFFETKKAELLGAFTASPIGDMDRLRDIHHQYKSLHALETYLQATMDSGHLGQVELDEINKIPLK